MPWPDEEELEQLKKELLETPYRPQPLIISPLIYEQLMEDLAHFRDPPMDIDAEIIQKIDFRKKGPINFARNEVITTLGAVQPEKVFRLDIPLDEIAGGALKGSPYQAFAWHDELYVGSNLYYDGLAHEVGHAFEYRAYCLKSPSRVCELGEFNWGIDPNLPGDREYTACELEVYLLAKHNIEGFGDMLDRHFRIGVLVQFDPEDDDESHFAEEELGGAQSAGEEIYNNIIEEIS